MGIFAKSSRGLAMPNCTFRAMMLTKYLSSGWVAAMTDDSEEAPQDPTSIVPNHGLNSPSCDNAATQSETSCYLIPFLSCLDELLHWFLSLGNNSGSETRVRLLINCFFATSPAKRELMQAVYSPRPFPEDTVVDSC